MKLQIILAIFAAVFVTTATAQVCPACPQEACPTTCTGELNVGTNCTTAPPRLMWYFDQTTRICRPMNHLGCGGNGNRWCSLLGCVLRCVLLVG